VSTRWDLIAVDLNLGLDSHIVVKDALRRANIIGGVGGRVHL